jgi:hypothetical protein
VNRLIFLILTCTLWSVPVFAELRLEVDLSERELRVLEDGETIDRFPVSIGEEKYPTPEGNFTIRKVIWNPAWVPPDSKWARGKTAKPPGHPENPMKRVKMFFKEPDYYIPEDVTRLAQLVMEHGGKPMPEPWYRKIFRRKVTKVVYLEVPIAVEIYG